MSEQTNLYKILQSLRQAVGDGYRELTKEGSATLNVSYAKCTVDDKWIVAIERGLDFVGKAIDEERRFIRSEGEVQPIEKVKRISKESIQHLARHGEFISRETNFDDNIVPDKLYTVERLNDYATYENRFLYRLLTTVKSFVSARYEPIAKATSSFSGKLDANLQLDFGVRKLNIAIDLLDERQNDDYLLSLCDAAERLANILRTVDFYLSTPLMVELSKVDMVQTVITKNNVLKMDKNFKLAVALYDYLLSYEGDGYSVEYSTQTLEVSEDVEALCLLLSFSDYVNALELSDGLASECEKERREQLEQLKRRFAEGDGAYLLVLQQRSELLDAAEPQIEQLKQTLSVQIQQTEQTQEQLQSVLAEKQSILQKCAEAISGYSDRLAQSKILLQNTITEFETVQNKLQEENLLLKAQLAVLATDKKTPTKKEFDELEGLYNALGRIVKKKWKSAKANIRNQARDDLKKQIFGKSKDNGDKQ
ncbi:MAG: DUF2357 domain-containing protein [Clostridiales bacterium]|nr:DUF2357 domain-containing protein [Clostridiales bacterium]